MRVVPMYSRCDGNIMVGFVLLSRFKYRDRSSIVLDILDTIARDPQGKTKTSIMRGANLNFEQVNKYLDHLVLGGLVKQEDPMRSQELYRYKLTYKGMSTVKHLAYLRDTFR